jgi:D-apionolactonase
MRRRKSCGRSPGGYPASPPRRQHLAGYDAKAGIYSGTDAYFTELNRGRPPVELLDGVCYSINPQVHAFDNASLAETLEAQGWTVESARAFTGDARLAISPVTLKPRCNPDATGPAPEVPPGALPPQVDERQMSLFGAGWTLGSLKYLAESGAGSVTYYETTGWRGVMEAAGGSPVPDRFRSLSGAVFPLYHVLADAGQFAGAEVLRSRSSETLLVDGLALRKHGTTRVLLANLSARDREVRVEGLPAQVRVRFLDETNAEVAMQRPEGFRRVQGETWQPAGGELWMTLRPYAIARIDGEVEA